MRLHHVEPTVTCSTITVMHCLARGASRFQEHNLLHIFIISHTMYGNIALFLLDRGLCYDWIVTKASHPLCVSVVLKVCSCILNSVERCSDQMHLLHLHYHKCKIDQNQLHLRQWELRVCREEVCDFGWGGGWHVGEWGLSPRWRQMMRLHCCKRVSQPDTGLWEVGGGRERETRKFMGTIPGAEIWNGCFLTASSSA